MEEIKTPKKYPVERAIEGFLKYLVMIPKTKLELYDKLSFYGMVSAITLFFLAILTR